MSNRILFVEDDYDFQKFISEILEIEGYEVIAAASATEAIEFYKAEVFDLVLTDLKMGAIDGLQLFSLLQRINPTVKVIVLTGSHHDADEIRGLEMSVSDYVKKPVSIEVLLTRIAKVLRESNPVRENILASYSENLEVDTSSRKVYQNGELILLTRKEFDLLVFFLKNKNAAHPRELILREVWRRADEFIDLRTVDTHVKKIRAKLHLSSIYAIRGIGYEWVEELEL